mmetsp:Transcript_42522/g.95593  ORF Transcript_42522/g.95593 Transcript_42522/m.95593 type:complete len:271 (-) Transcript_42522:60-872(-)
MVPRRLLLAWIAPLWPPLAMFVLGVLIVICHITAVASGKCDREKDGEVHTAYITEISLTAETPPESYIWTLGVVITWFVFLCPVAALLHELFWYRGRDYWLLLLPSQILFILATLALVGLATLTNKGTILEEENEIENGHFIHQRLADLFFLCSYLHGGLFVITQSLRYKAVSRLEKQSLAFKMSLLLLLALTVTGLLPLLVLNAAPKELLRPNSQIESLNRRGLTQRLVVLGVMLYVGSYGLEVLALRRHLGGQCEVTSSTENQTPADS